MSSFPHVGRLKSDILLKRHSDAGSDSVLGPPAPLVVKSFVGRKGFPDLALHLEGVRDRDAIAISVDLFFWKGSSGIVVSWKKPADIHIAIGDFKAVDRKSN